MHERLVKALLGPSVYEQLRKAINRSQTSSVIDITELHDAFSIAPKSVVAWLMANVAPMKEGESKIFDAPWDQNTQILVNKNGLDVYSGYFSQDGQVKHEYKLCSIPQLAAHILSFFELYDEALLERESTVESKSDSKEDKDSKVYQESDVSPAITADELVALKENLIALDAKINTLIMLIAGRSSLQKSAAKGASTDQQPEVKKTLSAIQKLANQLKKVSKSAAPSMPKPPKPGSKVGGQQGITNAGLHGNKTAFSDFNPKGGQSQTSLSPYLKTGQKLAEKFGLQKQPSTPKQPKLSLAIKSESDTVKCPDCGQHLFENNQFKRCACFFVLSDPKSVVKQGAVHLEFQSDWTVDDRTALLKSWVKGKRGK